MYLDWLNGSGVRQGHGSVQFPASGMDSLQGRMCDRPVLSMSGPWVPADVCWFGPAG